LPNCQLPTVANNFGIPFDESQYHNALYDARVCAQVAIQLGRLAGDEFDTFLHTVYETKPAKADPVDYERRCEASASAEFSDVSGLLRAGKGTEAIFTYTKPDIAPEVHHVRFESLSGEGLWAVDHKDGKRKRFLLNRITEVRPVKGPSA
jgi:DNA polymerase III epsilon subunit-like protein